MIDRHHRPLSAEEKEALERLRPRWLDRSLQRVFASSTVTRRTEELRLRDLEEGKLEEVKATRVVEIESAGEGPIVLFGSDSPFVVLLAGPRLVDPHLFSFDPQAAGKARAPEDWFTHFTVERSPHLGKVFRLRVHGCTAELPRRGSPNEFPSFSSVSCCRARSRSSMTCCPTPPWRSPNELGRASVEPALPRARARGLHPT